MATFNNEQNIINNNFNNFLEFPIQLQFQTDHSILSDEKRNKLLEDFYPLKINNKLEEFQIFGLHKPMVPSLVQSVGIHKLMCVFNLKPGEIEMVKTAYSQTVDFVTFVFKDFDNSIWQISTKYENTDYTIIDIGSLFYLDQNRKIQPNFDLPIEDMNNMSAIHNNKDTDEYKLIAQAVRNKIESNNSEQKQDSIELPDLQILNNFKFNAWDVGFISSVNDTHQFVVFDSAKNPWIVSTNWNINAIIGVYNYY
jgi:hypothetical protein